MAKIHWVTYWTLKLSYCTLAAAIWGSQHLLPTQSTIDPPL